jgi:hypothetical protein
MIQTVPQTGIQTVPQTGIPKFKHHTPNNDLQKNYAFPRILGLSVLQQFSLKRKLMSG